MLPLNIILLLFIFIAMYATGLLFSIVLLIESIRDRKIPTMITAIVLLIVYVAFYLSLM